jgi:hypothetical protein
MISMNTTSRRLAAIAAVTATAALAAPATGVAGEKFGTSFQGAVTPISSPQACPGGGGETCTRAPLYYDDPPHAGDVPFVPHDGTLDKVKVMADDPGSFRLQLVKLRNGFFPFAELKVKANGPRITYQGTGNVESFNVNVPVKEGWWLAQKARQTGALSCQAGPTNEAIVQPALALNAPFADADYYGGCTHLVQGVME